MRSRRLYSADPTSNMQKLKMEIADDLGIDPYFTNKDNNPDMGDLPSNYVGRLTAAGMLGGEMVKRMIAEQESKMIE